MIVRTYADCVKLDAGMHTGREGMAAMPYFDDFDLGTVDILLISQYVNHSPLFLLLSHEWQWRCGEGTSVEDEHNKRLLQAMTWGNQRCYTGILYDRSGQYNRFQPFRSLGFSLFLVSL